MKRDQLLQLIRSIFGAQDEELPCSEFFESLPGYVDTVLGAKDDSMSVLPKPKLTQVTHHMAQCPECAEAYEALLQVVRSAK